MYTKKNSAKARQGLRQALRLEAIMGVQLPVRLPLELVSVGADAGAIIDTADVIL